METESPLLYQPFASVPALEQLRQELFVNVPEQERHYSLMGGVAAIVAGLGRRSVSGALLAMAGVALVIRGATGHCPLYAAKAEARND